MADQLDRTRQPELLRAAEAELAAAEESGDLFAVLAAKETVKQLAAAQPKPQPDRPSRAGNQQQEVRAAEAAFKAAEESGDVFAMMLARDEMKQLEAGEPVVVTLTIPADGAPGDDLEVKHEGEFYVWKVPTGTEPGEKFELELGQLTKRPGGSDPAANDEAAAWVEAQEKAVRGERAGLRSLNPALSQPKMAEEEELMVKAQADFTVTGKTSTLLRLTGVELRLKSLDWLFGEIEAAIGDSLGGAVEVKTVRISVLGEPQMCALGRSESESLASNGYKKGSLIYADCANCATLSGTATDILDIHSSVEAMQHAVAAAEWVEAAEKELREERAASQAASQEAGPSEPQTVALTVPADADLGDELELEHEGEVYVWTVPAGTEPGEKFELELGQLTKRPGGSDSAVEVVENPEPSQAEPEPASADSASLSDVTKDIENAVVQAAKAMQNARIRMESGGAVQPPAAQEPSSSIEPAPTPSASARDTDPLTISELCTDAAPKYDEAHAESGPADLLGGLMVQAKIDFTRSGKTSTVVRVTGDGLLSRSLDLLFGEIEASIGDSLGCEATLDELQISCVGEPQIRHLRKVAGESLQSNGYKPGSLVYASCINCATLRDVARDIESSMEHAAQTMQSAYSKIDGPQSQGKQAARPRPVQTSTLLSASKTTSEAEASTAAVRDEIQIDHARRQESSSQRVQKLQECLDRVDQVQSTSKGKAAQSKALVKALPRETQKMRDLVKALQADLESSQAQLMAMHGQILDKNAGSSREAEDLKVQLEEAQAGLRSFVDHASSDADAKQMRSQIQRLQKELESRHAQLTQLYTLVRGEGAEQELLQQITKLEVENDHQRQELEHTKTQLTDWLQRANQELCEVQMKAATSPRSTDADKQRQAQYQAKIGMLDVAISENRNCLKQLKASPAVSPLSSPESTQPEPDALVKPRVVMPQANEAGASQDGSEDVLMVRAKIDFTVTGKTSTVVRVAGSGLLSKSPAVLFGELEAAITANLGFNVMVEGLQISCSGKRAMITLTRGEGGEGLAARGYKPGSLIYATCINCATLSDATRDIDSMHWNIEARQHKADIAELEDMNEQLDAMQQAALFANLK